MTESKQKMKSPQVKVPRICSISITPGFSEYVIKRGFRIYNGEGKTPACKIYLPRNWSGAVMFAVLKDGTAEPADPSFLPEHLRNRTNRRTHTAEPFSGQDFSYVFKTVCRQVKNQTDQHGNKYRTELKYVTLPPEWIGKRIVCIRALTDEQVRAISDNVQTINEARSDMLKMIGSPASGKNLTDCMIRKSSELESAYERIAELAPGFRSALQG